jgi:hypothetical protein
MKNITMRTIAFCLFILPVIFFAMPVDAIELTLNIPVELVNMPDTVTGGSVRCQAHGANRVSSIQYGSQFLGENQVRFDIRGTYRSTLKVVIKNNQPNPPNGLGYKCSLFLLDARQTKDAGGWENAANVLNRYAIDTSKPVRYEVSGIR